LQNASTFKKLGNSDKEEQILKQITNEYPEDHRAWLRFAQYQAELLGPYNQNENKYGEQNRFKLSEHYDRISAKLHAMYTYYKSALITAPEPQRDGIRRQAVRVLRSFLPFFYIEREKIKNYKTYDYYCGPVIGAADAEYNKSLKIRESVDVILISVIGLIMFSFMLTIGLIIEKKLIIPILLLLLLLVPILLTINIKVLRKYDPRLKRRVICAKKEREVYRMEHFARAGIPFEYYAGNKYDDFFGSRPTRLTEEDITRELAFWEKTVSEYELQTEEIPTK